MPDVLTFTGGLWLSAKAFSVGMMMYAAVRVYTTLTTWSDD